VEASVSITNVARSARFAAAWLALAALTLTFGSQLVTQLRELQDAGPLTAELCIRTEPRATLNSEVAR
jgi:hypothetical protein